MRAPLPGDAHPMAARRRAQLLLPTPLGLVEYDVLEDAVFLGPAKRGGLTADPVPFPEAKLAITRQGDGKAAHATYVVRALPGESTPVVNGTASDAKTLAGGDRIAIGDDMVAWRQDAPSAPAGTAPSAPLGIDPDFLDAAAAPAGTSTAGGARADARAGGRARAPVRRLKPNPWVAAVALAGALLCLVGVYRALGHLGGISADRRVQVYVPEPPPPPERARPKAEKSAVAFQEVQTAVAASPNDVDGALARYRDFHQRYPASPEADQARAKIRELYEDAAKHALARTDEDIAALLAQGQYGIALEKVRHFERRYGATESGAAAERLRVGVRAEARRALDALMAKVGPLIATNPRLAHRMLLDAAAMFPPDLVAEVTDLMERALQLMKSQRRSTPGPRDPRVPVVPRRPTPPDGATPPDTPPDRPVPAGESREAEARAQWKAAHDALVAGRYAEALDGFSLLSMRFGQTEIFRDNKVAIGAGRLAAKAGAQGPAGLLSVPVEEKRGAWRSSTPSTMRASCSRTSRSSSPSPAIGPSRRSPTAAS